MTAPSGVLVVVDMGSLGLWDIEPKPLDKAIRKAVRRRGAGEFSHGFVRAVAVAGVPTDAGLDVRATATTDVDAEPPETWTHVTVAVASGDAARTTKTGHVAVDESRLIVADPAALAEWKHDDALDGLADVAFWGRDEDEVAARFGAPRLPEGVYGWTDLDVGEGERRAAELSALRSDELRFAVDLRPHSHHWQLLAQMRASSTRSATLELGGARVCAFFTWGDGYYPVERDVDAGGRLLAIRIRLFDPDA